MVKNFFKDWWFSTKSLWSFVSGVDKRVGWFILIASVFSMLQPIITGYAMKPLTEAFNLMDFKKLLPLLPLLIIACIGLILFLIFKVPISKRTIAIELEYESKLRFVMHKMSYWLPYEWEINSDLSEKLDKYELYQRRLIWYMKDQLKVLKDIASTLTGLVVVLTFDWRVLVFMVILSFISGLSYYKSKRKIFDHAHDSEEVLVSRRAHLLEDSIGFPSNVQLHFTNNFFEMFGLAWNADKEDRVREIHRRVMKLSNNNTLSIIEYIANGSIIAYIAWQSLHGNISQALPAYIMGQMSYQGLLSVIRSIADQDFMSRETKLVFDVINSAKNEEIEDSFKQEPDISNGLFIKCNSMSYQYPNEGDFVFKNLNISFDFRKLYVLSGKNGGGKSTLMFLISGKLFPTGGSITINGIPTTNIKKSWFSKTFTGYYTKMNMIKSLSVREFIDSALVVPDNVLKRVIKEVGLDDKITDLSVIIGSYHPQGTDFSDGQRQRLLIARLLVQLQRFESYVLGDEITAHLHPSDQAYFFRLIKSYSSGGMLIAHNDFVVNECDVQIICSNGQISVFQE